jgi:hypothetical protein
MQTAFQYEAEEISYELALGAMLDLSRNKCRHFKVLPGPPSDKCYCDPSDSKAGT